MCVYIYIYIYVYMYVCVYIYIYICMYMCLCKGPTTQLTKLGVHPHAKPTCRSKGRRDYRNGVLAEVPNRQWFWDLRP